MTCKRRAEVERAVALTASKLYTLHVESLGCQEHAPTWEALIRIERKPYISEAISLLREMKNGR